MRTSKPFDDKEYLTNTYKEKFEQLEKQVKSGQLLTRTAKTGQTKTINGHNCEVYVQTYIDQDLNELYQVIKYVSIANDLTAYDQLEEIRKQKNA